MLSSRQTPKPARMREENCSPLSIVSNIFVPKRSRSIRIHRVDRDVTAEFRPLAEEPDCPAFSMSSEVRRNICAPQRQRSAFPGTERGVNAISGGHEGRWQTDRRGKTSCSWEGPA